MKVYFFGSPTCDRCFELLNNLANATLDLREEDEFCMIDAFDDSNEALCDEHNVDDLPHVKVVLSNGSILFEHIGVFNPEMLTNSIEFARLSNRT